VRDADVRMWALWLLVTLTLALAVWGELGR